MLAMVTCGYDDGPSGPQSSAPQAEAGADQSGETGQPFTLDGGGSSDADGHPLSCRWTEDTDTAETGLIGLCRSRGDVHSELGRDVRVRAGGQRRYSGQSARHSNSGSGRVLQRDRCAAKRRDDRVWVARARDIHDGIGTRLLRTRHPLAQSATAGCVRHARKRGRAGGGLVGVAEFGRGPTRPAWPAGRIRPRVPRRQILLPRTGRAVGISSLPATGWELRQHRRPLGEDGVAQLSRSSLTGQAPTRAAWDARR